MKKLRWALFLLFFSNQIQASPCAQMLKDSTKYTEFEVNFFTNSSAVAPYSLLRRLHGAKIATDEGYFSFESELDEWPTIPLLGMTNYDESALYVGQYTERSHYYEVWSDTQEKLFTFRIRQTYDANSKNLLSSYIVSKSLAKRSGHFEQRTKDEIPYSGHGPLDLLAGAQELLGFKNEDLVHIEPIMEVEAKRHSLKLYYTNNSGFSIPVGFFAVGKIFARSEMGKMNLLGNGGELEIDWFHIENNPDINKHKSLLVDLILSQSTLKISDQSKHELVSEFFRQKAKKSSPAPK